MPRGISEEIPGKDSKGISIGIPDKILGAISVVIFRGISVGIPTKTTRGFLNVPANEYLEEV